MTLKDVRVYTIPRCPHCETLKDWLKKHNITFEERAFDSEAQVDFIMKNIFSDPPILEVESEIFTSDEIFRGEEIDEERLREVFHEEGEKKEE